MIAMRARAPPPSKFRQSFTAFNNPASSSSSSALRAPRRFPLAKISNAFSINSHCCFAYLDPFGSARIFRNRVSNAYFLDASPSPSPHRAPSSSASLSNERVARARALPFVRPRASRASSNDDFRRPTLDVPPPTVFRRRRSARATPRARGTTARAERRAASRASSSSSASEPPGGGRSRASSSFIGARLPMMRASRVDAFAVAAPTPRRRSRVSRVSRVSRARADADAAAAAAAATTSALANARASARAGFSPGAGLELTAEEQAAAAYADLVNTSLDADGATIAADGVDALRAGGEMDATSTSRTSGNAVRAALELFDALRGGAHIVHDER